MTHVGPRGGQSEVERRGPKLRAGNGTALLGGVQRDSYLGIVERRDNRRANWTGEPRKEWASRGDLNDGVQWNQSVAVCGGQSGKVRGELPIDSPHLRRVKENCLHAIIEVLFRALSGLHVGGSFCAGDDASKIAPFSGDHCDERALETAGIREDDSVVTADRVGNGTLKSPDDRFCARVRGHALTR